MIDLYVVVYWTLSQLVLVREGCDSAFENYSQFHTVGEEDTCSAFTSQCSCMLQLATCLGAFLSLELNLGVKVVACRHGDQLKDVHMSTALLTRPCSIGSNGRTLHRSLLAPNPVDSVSKRLQHMRKSRLPMH